MIRLDVENEDEKDDSINEKEEYDSTNELLNNTDNFHSGIKNGKTKEKIITKVRCKYCFNDYRSYFYLKNHSEREHPDEPLSFTKRKVLILHQNINCEFSNENPVFFSYFLI